jgi:hypothetical protein
VPTELIQLYGGWRSDAYKKYLKFSLEDKISVADRMKAHILKNFGNIISTNLNYNKIYRTKIYSPGRNQLR